MPTNYKTLYRRKHSPSKMIASENCKIPSTMFNGAMCSVSLVRNDLKNDGVDWNDGWSYFLLRSFTQAFKEHLSILREKTGQRKVISYSKDSLFLLTSIQSFIGPFMVKKSASIGSPQNNLWPYFNPKISSLKETNNRKYVD